MKALCLVALASLNVASAQPPAPNRTVAQIVRSDAAPSLAVEIDPSLGYLGRGEGAAMDGRARYERFLFGEVRQGRLVRAAIVHFEHFVPGSTGAFNYPGFRMARLGGEDYLHQIWPQANSEIFRQDDIAALLAARGLTAESGWLTGRYARAVDAEKRHEVLIFYMEAQELLDRPLAELVPLWTRQGIAGPDAEAFESAFIARQRSAIRIPG